MKILFAVNDEKISESIIKRYQKDYKEIISAKNVYYYNAIIKELQKDKSYDRVIIGEDLEPFSSDDYSTIDKFLFDKLDKISDEAYNTTGNDIPIILICTDRRTRPEPFLVKLFGISIYNALIGQDRSIDDVCRLIKKPRSKKEAKIYYKIDSAKVEYKSENESDVSETEIQNILSHYKKLGKNEDKYVTSFESIASQYNDEQLKLIINFLPKNILEVLEEKSPSYRKINGLDPKITKKSNKANNNIKNQKIEILESPVNKTKMSSPVIIPGTVDTKNVKKVIKRKSEDVEQDLYKQEDEYENNKIMNNKNNILESKKQINTVDSLLDEIGKPTKRGRGRPPKILQEETEKNEKTEKRGRGRPPKEKIENDLLIQNEDEDILQGYDEVEDVLPGYEEEDVLPGYEEEDVLPGYDEEEDVLPGYDEEEDVLPGYDEEEDVLPGYDEEEDVLPGYEEDVLPGNDEDEEDSDYEIEDLNDNYYEENNNLDIPIQNVNFNNGGNDNINNSIQNKSYSSNQLNVNIDSLLTSDKKIVSFVGTTKNGTSFLINNLAHMLSEKGLKIAVLDLTQNQNSYYVYTDNREDLRNLAAKSIENLNKGIAEGIDINKNLTIYTSLPNNIIKGNPQNIIKTLLNNYSLILLDCDYKTDYSYFNISQEIYLVQSLDILTIQPLTAFLRELKAKNILDTNKLRVVINKFFKSSISIKMLLGGISSYNDPSMSYMTELFNKDSMKYITIPFELQNYSTYLSCLVDCRISLRGYTKNFLKSLEELGNMVFPLLGSGRVQSNYGGYGNNGFSKDTNSTLNRMKNKF